MIKSFEDLDVYRASKKSFGMLVRVTKQFPRDASYLSSQLNRAANSIHANIAEGFGRSSAEFKQYLRRALGSNNELLSHLDDALSAGYLSKENHNKLREAYTIVGKQLYRLRENWKDFS